MRHFNISNIFYKKILKSIYIICFEVNPFNRIVIVNIRRLCYRYIPYTYHRDSLIKETYIWYRYLPAAEGKELSL